MTEWLFQHGVGWILRMLRRARFGLRRPSPWQAAVALPILLNLVLLRSQLEYVEPNSDDSLHMAMVRWAAGQFASGHTPLDGWFPTVNLGSSQFHHYQSLPAILTAAVSGPLGTTATYLWTKYLLVCFWPLVVFVSARMLERPPTESAIAALISPLLSSVVGFGYEQTTYLTPGVGLYTQLWGMWTLPLAWGFSWRAINGNGRMLWAALFVALTIACHFITAYLAILALPVMWLSAPDRGRLWRASATGIAALALASWVLAPLIADSAFSPLSEFERAAIFVSRTNPYSSQPGAYYDSFGASQVLGWLFSGQLFDGGPAIAGRFAMPTITIAVAIGLACTVARWRYDRAGRTLAVLWILSLVLFFGPATLPVLRLMPGGSDMQFHRFLVGLQMTGIFLAATGAGWLLRECFAIVVNARRASRAILGSPRRDATAMVGLAAVIILAVPAGRAVSFDARESAAIAGQHAAESRDGPYLDALIADIKARGGGRTYAGDQFSLNRSSLGSAAKLGDTPVYAVLANHDVETAGVYVYTLSLSLDPEIEFSDSTTGPQGLGQYDMLNIRYVIEQGAGSGPRNGWTLIDAQGPYLLWQVSVSGYIQVVDTVAPAIAADRSNLGSASAAFMTSPGLAEGRYRAVAYDGQPAPPATLGNPPIAATTAGSVTREADALTDGHVGADVVANRDAVALLSASYDNRWTATVDGHEATTQMIAPALVGVAIPAGSHHVEFSYRPYQLYWLWFLLAAVTLVLLIWGGGLWRRLIPSAT